MKTINSTLKTAIAAAAIGSFAWSGNVSHAQSAAYSPDLQEVVKLSQARMPDDVIRNYIISTGKTYQLSADDIIYLNNRGVSSGIISTLQTADSGSTYTSAPTAPPPPAVTTQNQPAPMPQPVVTQSPYANTAPAPAYVSAPVEATPPPPQVNFQYFHDQLSPYGSWVNIGGVTYWRPDQAIAVDPDWRPYYDMGQWVQTEDGLYWQSDYTWGDIPFHYGRWVLNPRVGWLWSPDYTWGPAWVFWRQDEVDSCIGWAPLPVGAVYVNNSFFFNGVSVSLDFDFGIGESCFTFVSYDHFHEPFFRMRGHEWDHNFDHRQVHNFYSHSVVRNEFHHDEQGRFVNNGIGRDRIERLTHVEHAKFEERHPVGDRNRLATKTDDFHGNKTGGAGDQWHGQNGNPRNDHGTQNPTHTNPVNDRNVKLGENYTAHDQNFNNGHTLKTSDLNVSQHNTTLNNDRGTKAGDQNALHYGQPLDTHTVKTAPTGSPYGQSLGTQHTVKTGENLTQHDQSWNNDWAFKASGANTTIHEQPLNSGNARAFNSGGNVSQHNPSVNYGQTSNAGQNFTPHNPSPGNDRASMSNPSVGKVFRPPTSSGGGGGGGGAAHQNQSQQSQQSQQQHDKKK